MKYQAHCGLRTSIDFTVSGGFTLIELMIALTIAAILLMIAGPSYQSVTNSNRISAEVNGFVGDLQYARAEAIKEGTPVTMCVSFDGVACANSTSWNSGWIVFSDTNGNLTVDAGEPVLRVQKSFIGTDTFTSDNTISALKFNREGFALGLPGNVTVTAHDTTSNSHWTRCVAISIVGLLATQTAGTGSCT
jgi:type IV fimbrial biogenesis protein FimT